MTLDELRRTILGMKETAGVQLRTYGLVLGTDTALMESLVRALGEISVDEAMDVMLRDALKTRSDILATNRAEDRS